MEIQISSRVLFSRIKARLARELIQRVGARESHVIFLECGPNLSEVSFVREKKYSEIINVDSKHPRDMILQGHAFAARYLYTVHDVILDTLTGIVFSADGKIIAESSSWPVSHLLLNSIPKPPLKKHLRSIKGLSTICITSNGFYHWLVEDLPLFIYAMQNLEEYSIVVFENSPAYVDSFLLDKRNVVTASRFIHLDNYSFVSRGEDTEWAHPTDVTTLKESFSNLLQETIKGKNIYIPRLFSSRSPNFESDLVKELRAVGWQILETRNISLQEQIRQISSAETICGVHGAGLAGMIWTSPGARVIELSPKNFVPCFGRLSEICGLEYKRIPFLNSIDETGRDIAQAINQANTDLRC